MKRILPFALAVLFAGCATSPDVRTDFDPGAHFASYHTYTWLGKPTGISPLVEQRIVQGVDAHLQAKGWQPASSADTADVAVVANTVTQQQTTLDTFLHRWRLRRLGLAWRHGHGYLHDHGAHLYPGHADRRPVRCEKPSRPSGAVRERPPCRSRPLTSPATGAGGAGQDVRELSARKCAFQMI